MQSVLCNTEFRRWKVRNHNNRLKSVTDFKPFRFFKFLFVSVKIRTGNEEFIFGVLVGFGILLILYRKIYMEFDLATLKSLIPTNTVKNWIHPISASFRNQVIRPHFSVKKQRQNIYFFSINKFILKLPRQSDCLFSHQITCSKHTMVPVNRFSLYFLRSIINIFQVRFGFDNRPGLNELETIINFRGVNRAIFFSDNMSIN